MTTREPPVCLDTCVLNGGFVVGLLAAYHLHRSCAHFSLLLPCLRSVFLVSRSLLNNVLSPTSVDLVLHEISASSLYEPYTLKYAA